MLGFSSNFFIKQNFTKRLANELLRIRANYIPKLMYIDTSKCYSGTLCEDVHGSLNEYLERLARVSSPPPTSTRHYFIFQKITGGADASPVCNPEKPAPVRSPSPDPNGGEDHASLRSPGKAPQAPASSPSARSTRNARTPSPFSAGQTRIFSRAAQ